MSAKTGVARARRRRRYLICCDRDRRLCSARRALRPTTPQASPGSAGGEDLVLVAVPGGGGRRPSPAGLLVVAVELVPAPGLPYVDPVRHAVARAGESAGLDAVTAALRAIDLPLLAAAALAEGSFGELYRPASTAAIRRVVPAAQMPAAVARLEARSYGATIAGPPLGGILYGLARFAPFAGTAAGYAYSLLATLAVRTPLHLRQERLGAVSRHGGLTAGLAWLWRNRLLRALLFAAAGENFLFQALELAVILAGRTTGATSTEIGTMLAIAGALIATRLAATTHPSRIVLGIFWSTTALVPLMAINPNPYLLGAAAMPAPAASTPGQLRHRHHPRRSPGPSRRRRQLPYRYRHPDRRCLPDRRCRTTRRLPCHRCRHDRGLPGSHRHDDSHPSHPPTRPTPQPRITPPSDAAGPTILPPSPGETLHRKPNPLRAAVRRRVDERMCVPRGDR